MPRTDDISIEVAKKKQDWKCNVECAILFWKEKNQGSQDYYS
jgi:hypothetical protein